MSTQRPPVPGVPLWRLFFEPPRPRALPCSFVPLCTSKRIPEPADSLNVALSPGRRRTRGSILNVSIAPDWSRSPASQRSAPSPRTSSSNACGDTSRWTICALRSAPQDSALAPANSRESLPSDSDGSYMWPSIATRSDHLHTPSSSPTAPATTCGQRLRSSRPSSCMFLF